ncbi:hypothetical protein [Pseudomonas sp. nanlin1]|uniref:hypothetical protein n=1 Tax=Pseudomonas sp. nanlin1 TaxID=3040605 RepID=UPI00388DF4FB
MLGTYYKRHSRAAWRLLLIPALLLMTCVPPWPSAFKALGVGLLLAVGGIQAVTLKNPWLKGALLAIVSGGVAWLVMVDEALSFTVITALYVFIWL